MHHRILTLFTRLFQALLAMAIILGLINMFVRPNPNVSDWLAFVSLALAIVALLVYGITFGMKIEH
jgi:uncharacterized membrane protein YvlD (DUF360 family)